jgi:hypothetical protein
MVEMAFPAFAIPPLEQFAFQGVLKDNSGNLITGTRNIALRLYTVYSGHTATNDATCLPPNCLWTENHTNVQVTSGVFTINAGNIKSLTKVINFTNALYLEVIIQGSPDQILTPRLNITATPFAFASEKASTNLNLNKNNIINASSIYFSNLINGIMIDNSSQSIAGVSSLQIGKIGTEVSSINGTGGINGSAITVQKSSSIIGSISKTGLVNGSSLQAAKGSSVVGSISSAGLVNGSSIQVQNGGATVWNANSTGGVTSSALQVTNTGSKVASISKTGVVNGSSIQTGKGSSVTASISSAGVVNGSSLQIESGASHTNIATITASGITMSGANINLGSNFLTNSGHQIGLPSNSGTILLTNGTLSGGALSGTITGTPTLSGLVTSTGGITMSGANINLGSNFLTNSGHQIGLPSNSGTILLTNGTLSSLTGNLNSVGGTFTGTVNTASAITAPTSTNTINGIIINSGAISGVSTLTTTDIITSGGNLTANNGIIIVAGHLKILGNTPTVTDNLGGNTCGTVSGTDNAGTFTTTGIVASCTIKFASTYVNTPFCVVTSNPITGAFAAGKIPAVSSTSATQVVISPYNSAVNFFNGQSIGYLCVGN